MTPSSAVRWTPQPMSKHGDFVAKSFLSLLSRGSDDNGLSEPELLVRETAQNTWDARKSGKLAMSFRIVDVAPDESVHAAVCGFFGGYTGLTTAKRPVRVECLGKLEEVLGAETLALMYVRDTGTHGLGGPTDASIAVPDRGTDRYVKFLLNIGDANTDTTAGGAYGLGRSVFWRMSTCSTVVVYSRCVVDGNPESRLIGLSLGDKFVHNKVNYTGRHWWTAGEEGQPLRGPDADSWAQALGFEPYTARATGTTVLVVSPYAPAGTNDLALALARSIEYHLWPKYVEIAERTPAEPMTFAVMHNGKKVPVRTRAELHHTPLRHFIEAFADILRAQDGGAKLEEPKNDGPSKLARLSYRFNNDRLNGIEYPADLGVLSARVHTENPRAGAQQGATADDDTEQLESIVAGKIERLRHSVALMRAPELVVTYRRFEMELSVPGATFAGVFKSSPEANEFFRRAETSTHSEWDAAISPRTDRRVTKKFHELLGKTVSDWFAPKGGATPKGTGGVLAIDEASVEMGRWFTDWTSGVGDEPDNDPDDTNGGGGGGGSGGGGGGKRNRATLMIDAPEIVAEGESTVNRWKITARSGGAFRIDLEIREADDDGRSTREVNVAPGARPAIVGLSADTGFRLMPDNRTVATDNGGAAVMQFVSGPTADNRVECTLEFGDGGEVQVTVSALVESGTLPVLGADIRASGPAGATK